jgi:zinc transport system substrate-binding protein
MKKAFPILYIVFFALSFGCGKTPRLGEERPKVLVSMAPYKAFVEFIGEDAFDVICLTPKGADPHFYEAPPKLLEESLQAKLWLRIGELGEKKFVDLFKQRAPNMQILNLSEGIPLQQAPSHCLHGGEEFDRHIWLSPPLASLQASMICDLLCELMPARALLFRDRLALLQKELQELDTELADYFAQRTQRAVLTTHPALHYFCHEYGLEQITIEVEGREPLPREVAQLFDKIQEHQIDRVLIQPQHSSQGALRLAEELHLEVGKIDPYAENYFTNLREIAHAIGE